MNLVLLVTTYFTENEFGYLRMENALYSIATNCERLQPVDNLSVSIGDDCSNEFVFREFEERLRRIDVATIHLNRADVPRGVGGSLNAAIAQCEDSIYLYMVDDWVLTEQFAPQPWMNALENNPSLCAVRLGPPHPYTRGTIEAIGLDWDNWAIRLDRQGFAFATRPSLWHPRMFEKHGHFKVNCNAFECEEEYAVRMNNCLTHGPCIAQAIHNPFYHEFVNELADVERKWGVAGQ